LALCLHDQADEEAWYPESHMSALQEEVTSRISDKEYLATFRGKGKIGRKPRELACLATILLVKSEERWSMPQTMWHL
jgi:hypothetical protein